MHPAIAISDIAGLAQIMYYGSV